MDRIGVQPILPVTIDIMLDFNCDFDGLGDVTHKQTCNVENCTIQLAISNENVANF